MTVATAFELEDIRAKLAERQANAVEAEADAVRSSYRYIRPLVDSADSLIDYVTNPEGRFLLGLHEIDLMTRGFARGELVMLSGRSHAGKSQVVLNAIANNRDSHIVYFSFDESTELVLAKLASITTGISGDLIEDQIKAGNQETIDQVRRVATHEFRNLVVIDDVLRLSECMKAIQEAEDYWGTPCDVAVFDYLELIPGGTGDQSSVVSTSQNLKKLIKDANVVGLVIHQSRTSGTPRGKPAGLESMRYGGTSEAIFVLEMYRPCEDDDLPEWEALRLANFINVNLCKNKRPPSKKGDKRFFLHPETGRIREPRPEDLIVPGAPITDASVAARAHAGGQQ